MAARKQNTPSLPPEIEQEVRLKKLADIDKGNKYINGAQKGWRGLIGQLFVSTATAICLPAKDEHDVVRNVLVGVGAGFMMRFVAVTFPFNYGRYLVARGTSKQHDKEAEIRFKAKNYIPE